MLFVLGVLPSWALNERVAYLIARKGLAAPVCVAACARAWHGPGLGVDSARFWRLSFWELARVQELKTPGPS